MPRCCWCNDSGHCRRFVCHKSGRICTDCGSGKTFERPISWSLWPDSLQCSQIGSTRQTTTDQINWDKVFRQIVGKAILAIVGPNVLQDCECAYWTAKGVGICSACNAAHILQPCQWKPQTHLTYWTKRLSCRMPTLLWPMVSSSSGHTSPGQYPTSGT